MSGNGAIDISYINEKIISGGYRITKQRYEIIKLMHENNRHMNADEIYIEIKDKNIGLSTIYRNLMILERVGVVKRINAVNKSYYELQTLGEVYTHAKCIKCNKIIDIKEDKVNESLDDIVKILKKEYKVAITSTSILLSVICEECENNNQFRIDNIEGDFEKDVFKKEN